MTEAQKQTAGIAIASMILGILGFFCLGPLASIPAVICGHIGMSKIKQNPETLDGSGMALAGVIMGYVQLGLMLLMIPILAGIMMPAMATARNRAREAQTEASFRMIEVAAEAYKMEKGELPSEMKQLQADELFDGVNLNDAWDNPIVYKLVDGKVVLQSLGPDGIESDDDIVYQGAQFSEEDY